MRANLNIFIVKSNEKESFELEVDLDGCAKETVSEGIDNFTGNLTGEWSVDGVELDCVGGFDNNDEVLKWFWGASFDIDDLDDFAGKCADHGVAYELRYMDIGDHDFEEEYNGCWGSEAEFAHSIIDDCYAIPDPIRFYIDYEKWARDVMMDYSGYTDSCGDLHIFRD